MSSKAHILVVCSSVPFPAHASGEALRYSPIIHYLAARYDVHVVVMTGFPVDWEAVKGLEQCGCRVSVIEYDKLRYGRLRAWWTKVYLLLPWTPPISLVPYASAKASAELRKLTKGCRYKVALWVGAQQALYASAISADRHVTDFVDSPTLMMHRQVVGALQWPLLQAYDLWKLRRQEARLRRAMDACIYISEVDAGCVSSARSTEPRPHVVPNGVLVDRYTSSVCRTMRSPSIGFLGNMAYPPNIEAVHWLYRHVFLPIRVEMPSLTCYVIGRLPDESIQALGKEAGMVVTGEVPDVWPYVNGVDVFVFPLWKGTGVKNKMLEVMYAARSIAASPIAVEGIEGVPGRDFHVCETQEQFVETVTQLLKNPVQRDYLGRSASRLVKEQFSWHKVLPEFEGVLLG